MPLFDYGCTDCGKVEEEIVSAPFPELMPCECGGSRRRMIGVPSIKLMWALPPMDDPKDIWEGFPLEGTDGVNESNYKRKKSFFYNKE